MHMKAVATTVPFYIDEGPDGVQGPLEHIWQILRSQLNISLSVEFVGLLDMGQITSSTDGTGMMGSLLRNETQFSIIPQYLDELGVKYLGYTTITAQEEWIILSGPPKIYHSDYFASLSSFQNTLWIAVTCSLFSFSLVWSLLLTIKKYFKFRLQSLLFEFQNCLFSSYKSLINQDLNRIGHFYERLCVIGWLIAAYNLSISFTGVMFSKLAKADDPFRYETLEDFLINPIKLILLEDSPPYNEIKNSKHPTAVKIWNKVVLEDTAVSMAGFDPAQEFMEMSLGNVACVMFKRAILATSAIFCGTLQNVYISKDPLVETMFTMYFRKDIGLQFQNTIKNTMHKLVESHLLTAKIDQLAELGEFCIIRQEEVLTMPLSIHKFYFILIFYGFTMALATCCLIIEMSLPSIMAPKKRQKKRILELEAF